MSEQILLTAADLGDFLDTVGEQAGVASSGGTPNTGVEEIVGKVISAALGVLGVIFLVLSVYAGFLWATSQGSEEKIKKAKQILSSSIIGLIITLAAYSISSFVVENITKATGV